jgi:hypothetical protein
MVAVLPLEHDLAYTEDETKTWVEVRQEAEQQALQANKNLTLLSSDIIYADQPTHLIQYLTQCIDKSFMYPAFMSDAAFRPVNADDVASAVAHVLSNVGHG